MTIHSNSNNKRNLAIMFGGRSCEHEVSVTSAKAILQAIDTRKYDIYLIAINKQGHWFFANDINKLTNNGEVISEIGENADICEVTLPPYAGANLQSTQPLPKIEVMFSVLHGPFGEDGHIQGLLNMADMAYVGCDLAASAIAMDKSLTKKVLHSAHIPQCPYLVFTYPNWQQAKQNQNTDAFIQPIYQQLGNTHFIKPASMGSSVGISKASNPKELIAGIEHAFEFDNTILVETSLEGYAEIECSILGGNPSRASVLGEIIPHAQFYDYDTKYINSTTQTVIPAQLPEALSKRIQQCAIEAFDAIGGRGMARIDFLVDKQEASFVLNEINTLPGFTPISMYPKLWQASDLQYSDLIDTLISLALEEQQHNQRIRRVL